MNILMISWVAGYFPDSRRQAFLCSSGSNGYSAFRRSLWPNYPEHTVLLTNVDLLDMQLHEEHKEEADEERPSPCTPFSVILRVQSFGPSGRLKTYPEASSLLSGQHHAHVISNIKTTPHSFLQGCVQLRTIDISGLGNVTKISSAFLVACRGLSSIDLSAFVN